MSRSIWKRIALTLALLLGGAFVTCCLIFGWFLLTTKTPAPSLRTTAQDDTLPAQTIDGYRFHLEAHGNPTSPVVVVLHGGPGNDYRYLLPLSALEDEFRVVFYDQRSSGLSPRVADEDLTLERFLGDLDAIGRAFSPSEPIRLIGHSWGGMLAAAYLARYPERVSQAVLAEPGFLTSELGNRFVTGLDRRTKIGPAAIAAVLRAAASAVKLPGTDGDPDARLDHFATELSRYGGPGNPVLGYFCGRDLATAALPSWRLGTRTMSTLLGKAEDADGRVTLDLSRGLERFPREVLLVAGSCNEIIGPEVQELHRRLFRRARLAIITGAGHTMFGERTDESLALIRQYFAQTPP